MNRKTRVHRIEVPTPYVIGPVNVHVLVGDAVVLIDSGPRTPEGERILSAGLARAGVSLRNVDALLLTHAHLDHFGMAARVREISGARVYAHESERAFLEGFPWTHQTTIDRFARHAREHGFPPSLFSSIAAYFRGALDAGEAVKVDRTYRDGERLEFGRLRLDTIVTPGHTMGSTCFFDPDGARLFSGDTVLEHLAPFAFFRGWFRDAGIRQYKESLHKLSDLRARTVHPGHRKDFRRLPEALRRIERHLERRRGRILSELGRGDRTAFEIADSAFGARGYTERWTAFAETLGILESLSEEGRVREVEGEDAVRFRSA